MTTESESQDKWEKQLEENIELFDMGRKKTYERALKAIERINLAVEKKDKTKFAEAEKEFIDSTFMCLEMTKDELMYRVAKIGYPIPRFQDLIHKLQKESEKTTELHDLEFQWNPNYLDWALEKLNEDNDQDEESNSDEDKSEQE